MKTTSKMKTRSKMRTTNEANFKMWTISKIKT